MKNYFNFNRNEKIGVITLACLILGLTIFLNVGSATYLEDPYEVDYSELDFVKVGEEDKEKTNSQQKSSSQITFQTKISDFNPNDIGKEKWISFGFSKKQAESILKYRDNFGPFKSKKDIQKIYVISDEMYQRIAPHIIFDQENEIDSLSQEIPPEILKVDLNSATHEELVAIKWIGPTFAQRILDLRLKTGGFVEFSQLNGIYLSDEAIISLQENTVLNPNSIQRKNVNTISKEELKKLPFSNWVVTAEILKQRDRGALKNLDFLTEDMISKSDKEKLMSYLIF